MERYFDRAADFSRGILERLYPEVNNGRCESPIEEGFLIGLLALWMFNRTIKFDEIKGMPVETDYQAKVLLQHQVDRYRLDFAIHLTASSGGRSLSHWFAIECDGHDFHERTKVDAKRDRSRDRDLTAKGFTVVRFTGSEIHADAMACVLELLRMVIKRYDDWADGAP